MTSEVRTVGNLEEGGAVGAWGGGSWGAVMSYFSSQVLIARVCSIWESLCELHTWGLQTSPVTGIF